MFYTLDEALHIDINWPDVYFTPEYGRAVAVADGGRWECYYITDSFLYVYLIRNDEIKSPYGYAGMYVYPGVTQKQYEHFRSQFLQDVLNRGYTSEFIRKNPYLSTFEITDMELKLEKVTFGMDMIDYDTYWKKAAGDHRNMVNKAVRLGYHCDFHPITINELQINSPFRELYSSTMNYNNAKEYYYFDDEYFSSLEKIPGLHVAYVYNGNKVIGCSLFFIYPPYLHYHLSANDRSSNCITDFLLNRVLKMCFQNTTIKYCHLGGGVSMNDSLSRFKRKICPQKYKYCMYTKTF